MEGAGTLQKYIALYLGVTGVPAVVALLFPGLVMLGMYLLVVPGLILGAAPTAFLWGCVFAAFWVAVKTPLGDTVLAALAAGLLTGVSLYAVTQPFRIAGNALYRETLLPDVNPPSRIAMTGDVRIDVPLPRWDNVNKRGRRGQRGFACDNLCLARLFTPGVKSVTINRSGGMIHTDAGAGGQAFDPEARTYWLTPKAECADGGLRSDLEGRRGLFRGPVEEGRALAARWELWLANAVCLQRSAAIGRHDILIRHRRERAAARWRQNWSLVARVSKREEIEVQDASGAVLLRRLQLSVFMPSRLLAIGFEGGPDSMRAGWSGETLTNGGNVEAMLGLLEEHTNTVGR